jgi:hypothetical protein
VLGGGDADVEIFGCLGVFALGYDNAAKVMIEVNRRNRPSGKTIISGNGFKAPDQARG